MAVTLTNTGDEPVKVRSDFLIEPVLGDLAFEFSRNGKVYPQTSHVEADLPDESWYEVLEPRAISGVEFEKNLVSRFYSLPTGCYSVTAIFHDPFADKFAAYAVTIRSRPRKVCVKAASHPRRIEK